MVSLTNYQSDEDCVGQSDYWLYFAAYIVAGPFLIVGAIYAVYHGSWPLGILSLLMLPVINIVFRIIMMRRCRDIGWPVFLPWSTLGLSFVTGILVGASGASAATLTDPYAFSPLIVLPLLTTLFDLGLMIAIGCFPSRQYRPVDAEEYQRLYRDLPQAPIGYAESAGKASYAELARTVSWSDDAGSSSGFGRRGT